MGLFSRKKKKEPAEKVPVDNGNWNLFFRWAGEEGQYPILLFFDETYAEATPKDFGQGVEYSVYLHQEDMTKNALPSPETNAKMQAEQEKMVQAVEAAGIPCKLIGRLTGAGRKVYRFQSRDGKALVSVLEQWGQSLSFARKVAADTRKDWTFYTGILPNNFERMQIDDRRTIEALMEHGADPNELHLLEFHFAGPAEALQSIREDLEEEGFEALGHEGGNLTMAKALPLDLKTIYDGTCYMRMSALSKGAEYQGWGSRIG